MRKAMAIIVLLIAGAMLFSGCTSTENKTYDRVVENNKTTITVGTNTEPIVTTINSGANSQSNLKNVVLDGSDVESRFSLMPEMSGAINIGSGYAQGYTAIFIDNNPSELVVTNGQPTMISSVVYDYSGRESDMTEMLYHNKTNEIGKTIGDVSVKNVIFLGSVDNLGDNSRMWLTEGEVVSGGQVYETQDVVLIIKKNNYLVLITTMSPRNSNYEPLVNADKKYARIVIDRLP